MGRLIAGVIALAIGVLGAMYWGQAQQADASQRVPLVSGIEAPAAMVDGAESQTDGAQACPYMNGQSKQGGACEGRSCEGKGGGGCCKGGKVTHPSTT